MKYDFEGCQALKEAVKKLYDWIGVRIRQIAVQEAAPVHPNQRAYAKYTHSVYIEILGQMRTLFAGLIDFDE